MLHRIITNAELVEGCQKQFESYLSGEGPYAELAQTCVDTKDKIPGRTTHIPGVDLIVNSALDVLAQPDVYGRISPEIATRTKVAVKCVNRVAKLIGNDANRQDFGQASDILLPLDYGLRGRDFGPNSDLALRLSRAAFIDVCILAGGAVRFLDREDTADEESRSAIIARSSGLLDFSRIRQNAMKDALDYLGRPYADTRHYVWTKDRKVDFAAEAKDTLQNMRARGRGCPAHRVPSPDNTKINLLQDRWGAMVQYMVPEEAKASDRVKLSSIRTIIKNS
ncbi:MAG TPA: hypothetical protein VD947_03925 [Patescibacteria group bacterium]|nr:hypothetical protein [Patescibacteria group bacterium]